MKIEVNAKADLSFFGLTLKLITAGSAVAAIGAVICNWHLDRWLIAEAILAATAAIIPQLMAGHLASEIARRYSLLVAGAFFMDFRLTLARVFVALSMLVIGLEVLVAVHTEAALVLFGAIYVVLIALGAHWMATGARAPKSN